MDCVRIQTGATEQIVAVALDASLVALTGLTDLKLMIRRVSDGWSYDFADATFKVAGWGTRQQAMTEVSAANYPGEYQYTWNTGAITNPTANDAYLLTVTQTPGTTVKNVPQVGELKVGQYVDKLDATVSSRSTLTQAQILSDATPFQGARIDAAISSRAAPGDAMDLVTDAVDAAAVAASAVAEIQSGLATAAAVAAVQADTDDLQTRVPAALVGGRMDSSVGAMATDTLTAAALAADAVAEIQAGLATSASLAFAQADLDDLQTRVPATLVGGRMRSHVEAMDTDVIGAAQIAAGAITAVESPPLANLDAAVSSRAAPGAAMDLITDAVDASALAADAVAEINSGLSAAHGAGSWEGSSAAAVAAAVWDEAKAGHSAPGSFGEEEQSHATPAEVVVAAGTALVAYDAATGTEVASRAAPGDAMDLVTDAVDASALAASAVSEIDAALSSAHGAGSWEGSTAAVVAAAVWNEAKAGHIAPGSFGEEEQSHATPAEVKAEADAALVDYDAATGTEVATRAVPGDAMDLVAGAVDASSLDGSAVSEIDAGLSVSHGAGSWEGSSAAAVADAVWDEAVSGHVTPGTFGRAVQDVGVARAIMQAWSYNQTNNRLDGVVWAETSAGVVLTPTSCSVKWYDRSGTLLFTITDAAPDPQGVFKLEKLTPGLTSGELYYAVASVVVGTETVTGAKGAFTL